MEKIIKGIFEIEGRFYFETIKKQFSDSNEDVNDQIKTWHQEISKFLIVTSGQKKMMFEGQLLLNCNSRYTVYLNVNNIPIYHRNTEDALTICFQPEEACAILNQYTKKGFDCSDIEAENQRFFNNEIKSIKDKIDLLKHMINSVKNVTDKSGINFLSSKGRELSDREEELNEWKQASYKQAVLVKENEMAKEKVHAVNFLNSI